MNSKFLIVILVIVMTSGYVSLGDNCDPTFDDQLTQVEQNIVLFDLDWSIHSTDIINSGEKIVHKQLCWANKEGDIQSCWDSKNDNIYDHHSLSLRLKQKIKLGTFFTSGVHSSLLGIQSLQTY